MKPLYLSLILTCICHNASAQLLDRLGNQIDGVTRELERVTDDVQEQVMRAAEDQVAAQVLESTLNNVVINPLVDPLATPVVAPVIDSVVDPVIDPLTNALGQTVDGAARALPTVLPILDRNGGTALVEVRVEDNWRAVEREWLMLVDQPGLKALAALDAEIIEQTTFTDLGLQLVRFKVPVPLDSFSALKKHLPAHLHEQLDRNHIYAPQQGGSQAPAENSAVPTTSNIFCNKPVNIGMIDTAINTRHTAFAQNHIEIKDFAGEEFDAPRAHGTAVAGVLVGRGEQLTPLLPAANLFAASVFYPRSDYAQGATMINLVRALDWLLQKKVSVINMSLAGPDNKILALAIQKAIQAGASIVAAAGNEGPAAPPAYPAAYADVIAVTAVDKNQRIYRWANRGDYIDFAAAGVAVFTARSSGDYGGETGTSMAAPLVTAAVACLNSKTNTLGSISEQLKTHAIDLGAPGRDPVFGDGLLTRP